MGARGRGTFRWWVLGIRYWVLGFAVQERWGRIADDGLSRPPRVRLGKRSLPPIVGFGLEHSVAITSDAPQRCHAVTDRQHGSLNRKPARSRKIRWARRAGPKNFQPCQKPMYQPLVSTTQYQ